MCILYISAQLNIARYRVSSSLTRGKPNALTLVPATATLPLLLRAAMQRERLCRLCAGELCRVKQAVGAHA
jgi:hypothetical protein